MCLPAWLRVRASGVSGTCAACRAGRMRRMQVVVELACELKVAPVCYMWGRQAVLLQSSLPTLASVMRLSATDWCTLASLAGPRGDALVGDRHATCTRYTAQGGTLG